MLESSMQARQQKSGTSAPERSPNPITVNETSDEHPVAGTSKMLMKRNLQKSGTEPKRENQER